MPPLFIAHDGQVAYYVDYDPADPQKIRTVRRTPEINFGFHAVQTPALMCGMRVPGLEGTLCDLMVSNAAKIVATEQVFSARCLHIAVSEYVGLGGYRTAIDVWLDIERDFLPRKIVFKITDEAPEIIPRVRNRPACFEAPELQSVPDELLGRSRWFPQTITVSDFSGLRRMSVNSVTFNRHLANSFFQPTMSTGTVIIEGEDHPFEKRRITVVGGSNAAASLVDQRLQDAAKLKAPDAPQGFVNANERHGWNWSLCVSVVCLLVLAGIGARNLWFRA